MKEERRGMKVQEKEEEREEGGEREERKEEGNDEEGKLIPIIFTLLLHLGNIDMHKLFKAFLHLQTRKASPPCFWKT